VLVVEHRRNVTATKELLAREAGVPGWGGKVGVGLPAQAAASRADDAVQRMVIISGAATLILLVLQGLFIRRWLPALGRLERAADRVGSGDLTPLAAGPMPARELEHLQEAFREMVEKLRSARENVESLQQQVIRQERLAAIGVLVSGIAHEINNPLQAISGLAEVLEHQRDVRPGIRNDLILIQKESVRASNIIRNLSRFSRQQSSKPVPVRVSDVVASVFELRQRRFQDQSIQVDLQEAATRPAHVVFTELQQVLLNFVINAEQAMAAQPAAERRIMLRTRDTAAGVHIEVEDTGPGVRPEDESKLFQPFFTTKPVGEGTGLGLSVSYGIARSLGGSIGYRRGAAGGALFFIEVPASPPDAGRPVSA
jgi:C4-dicarboxylate-specific signal transduction histidine kinase